MFGIKKHKDELEEIKKEKEEIEAEIRQKTVILNEREKLEEDKKELKALKDTLHPSLYKIVVSNIAKMEASLTDKDMSEYEKKKKEQARLLEEAKKKLIQVT